MSRLLLDDFSSSLASGLCRHVSPTLPQCCPLTARLHHYFRALLLYMHIFNFCFALNLKHKKHIFLLFSLYRTLMFPHPPIQSRQDTRHQQDTEFSILKKNIFMTFSFIFSKGSSFKMQKVQNSKKRNSKLHGKTNFKHTPCIYLRRNAA